MTLTQVTVSGARSSREGLFGVGRRVKLGNQYRDLDTNFDSLVILSALLTRRQSSSCSS